MSISPRPKVFRSRISVLLIAIILAAFILTFALVSQDEADLGLYMLGGFFFLVMFLLTGMRYIISGSKLSLKICFISGWSVDIADIRLVERSYNPLSSPAASLKRLHILIKGKTKLLHILISPVKEQMFIHELKALNPDIVVNVPEKKGTWHIWDWDI
jgi:hypothetical protein